MATCLIGLGSNLGDRSATLQRALKLIEENPLCQIRGHSRWHETAPVGGSTEQGPFLNGTVLLEVSHSPDQLLELLWTIERRLGRVRRERWSARTIDLDLLLYDRQIIDSARLRLPHPAMAFRRFVLASAVEVAAELVHPVIGWTVQQLWEHLNHATPYVAIAGAAAIGKTKVSETLARQVPARQIADPPHPGRWSRLEDDSAGQAWRSEVEFLQNRVRQLDTDLWPDTAEWVVSDYWFDQSVAIASELLSPPRRTQYQTMWQQARVRVTRPKLVVLLDIPAEELATRIAGIGYSEEESLTISKLDRLRDAVARRVFRPDVGPALRVDACHTESAVNEITSAIQAMQ